MSAIQGFLKSMEKRSGLSELSVIIIIITFIDRHTQ